MENKVTGTPDPRLEALIAAWARKAAERRAAKAASPDKGKGEDPA